MDKRKVPKINLVNIRSKENIGIYAQEIKKSFLTKRSDNAMENWSVVSNIILKAAKTTLKEQKNQTKQ